MIAVFGGSFDPVHLGHIKLAVELSRRAEIDQLRFLLCRHHPQKKIPRASLAHRLAMLRLVESPPELLVDLREVERDKVSYTVDSLCRLRAECGLRQSLAFVLGEDAFAAIASWHHYERLLDYANLIVLARPDYPPSRPHQRGLAANGFLSLANLASRPAGGIARFANRRHNISSTMIREMIARQQTPRYCLPAGVWCYIRSHHLYGWHGEA